MATIKLTNSVLIDSTNLAVGIDPHNLLQTIATNATGSFTMPDDCFVFVNTRNGIDFTIDSISFSGNSEGRICYFLKKGQVISSLIWNTTKIYGHK